MKLSEIKTISELMDVGDNWHQRGKKLQPIIYSVNEPPEKRAKAAYLLSMLTLRCSKIAQLYAKHSELKNVNFEKGGLVA